MWTRSYSRLFSPLLSLPSTLSSFKEQATSIEFLRTSGLVNPFERPTLLNTFSLLSTEQRVRKKKQSKVSKLLYVSL